MKTYIKTLKIIWLSSLFALACPVMGQAGQTPQLDLANDSLWSTLESHDLSADGKWVSYSLRYESGHDTLFVRNTRSKKTLAFPKGSDGKFIGEESFSFLGAYDTFQVLDLKTLKVQKVADVRQFDYGNDNLVLVLLRPQGTKSQLELRDKNLKVLKTVDSVTIHSLNPGKSALAYIASYNGEGRVGYIALEKELKEFTVITSKTDIYQNLVWHKDGQLLTFVNQLPANPSFSSGLVLFDARTNATKVLDIEKAPHWPKDMLIASPLTEMLGVTDDGTAVYFKVKQKEIKPTEANPVQVWNAADKDLYEYRARYGDLASQNRLAVWHLESSLFEIIGTETQPAGLLLPKQQHAVLADGSAHKPARKYTADVDYYLLDLLTKEKILFLQKDVGDWRNLESSPNGKYIAYAKEGQWWVYDVARKTHRNLTGHLKNTFFDEDNDMTIAAEPYGVAGWAKDEKILLLYDKYDVWQIDVEGNSVTKLTKGRDQGLIFRIEKQSAPAITPPFSKPIKIVNLEEQLVLEGLMDDHSKSGYFTFRKDKGVRPFVFESKKINGLRSAKDSYLYVQQRYDAAPTLAIFDRKRGKSNIIFKSNPHFARYKWGKSELIQYTTAGGERLKGVLCYPFDYNPNQQYPMIVKIYERQLHTLHGFTNPSLLDGTGFNRSNYTSRGYFVFYPDIVYKLGSPGFAATDCIVSATKAALSKASINPKKIGLIGHSYGGYETNFIITQANLFAAAVSGAGISDLTSCYLSVGWSYAKDNSWRYEHEQMRMDNSLFEDKEGYRNNSPIEHAEKVKTPLLCWTGDSDTQVNSYQSFEWYEALRRLKKEHVLLVYPKENHVLINEKHQNDLNTRIMEWFDFYLLNGRKMKWMVAE